MNDGTWIEQVLLKPTIWRNIEWIDLLIFLVFVFDLIFIRLLLVLPERMRFFDRNIIDNINNN